MRRIKPTNTVGTGATFSAPPLKLNDLIDESRESAHLFRIEVLQVVQREDRLKSFPKRLKLPRDTLIERPVDHQLQTDGTRGDQVRAVYSGYTNDDICQIIQSPTLRYSSRLWMVTGTSLPPFFNSMFGNPGRVKSKPRSSTEQPFMLRLSKACWRVSRVWQTQAVKL